jgi:hypothetical protein
MAERPPLPKNMEALVRKIAQDSANVFWRSSQYTTHAATRMQERGITDLMMFEVLRSGFLSGTIKPGKNPNEWKVKMTKPMRGRREVGVVTLVIRQSRLFVVTVEWED